MPKRTTAPNAARLDARMTALEAADTEVGALIDRDAEEVAAWRHGDAEIDAEAAVLLRPFLADAPQAAQAALQRIRRTFHRTWEGDRVALKSTAATVGPAVRDGERSAAPAAPNGFGRAK